CSWTTTTPDIWTELKELRDMVVEWRTELRNTEARLKDSEDQDVEELKTGNAAQADELSAMEARVTASESGNTALKARVTVSEREVEELKAESPVRPKVAFSASWANLGQVGPFDNEYWYTCTTSDDARVSNTLSLELEEGDVVSIRLPKDHRVQWFPNHVQ
uniref:Uncharacterized protein n=1 Tax=Oncorhynchus tshawytscha TaxID=74940 RepID=A0A8C8G581_ONCTS